MTYNPNDRRTYNPNDRNPQNDPNRDQNAPKPDPKDDPNDSRNVNRNPQPDGSAPPVKQGPEETADERAHRNRDKQTEDSHDHGTRNYPHDGRPGPVNADTTDTPVKK